MSDAKHLTNVRSVRRTCPKRPRASPRRTTSTCSRSRRDATKPEIKAAVELMFKVKVEARATCVNVKGKEKRFGSRTGRRGDWKKAYVSLAEARRSTCRPRPEEARPWHSSRFKPTSPGRRVAGQGRQRRTCTRASRTRRWSKRRSKTGGRNNNGHITTRHKGGGHKQHYRIVDFKRNKDGIAGARSSASSTTRTAPRTSRCCATPTASAATSSRRKGVAVGDAADVGRRGADQGRQHAAAAQHPGRLDRSTASRCSPARARRSRARAGAVGAAAGARRHLRAAAPALGRDPQGARRLPRHDRRSRQRRAQPALRSARPARKRWRGIRPTVRGVAMNPVDHPHGGGEGQHRRGPATRCRRGAR